MIISFINSYRRFLLFLLNAWQVHSWKLHNGELFQSLYSMIKYSNINQFHINIYNFIMCENDELGVRVWSKVKAKLSPWYTFFSFKGCSFSTFDTTEWCELCSIDPSFKPKNQFRRLYFWKSGQHMPTKKLFAYLPPPHGKKKRKEQNICQIIFFFHIVKSY